MSVSKTPGNTPRSAAGNSAPLLINDNFVSYFPALGRALGSVEDAVIVQELWYRRDWDTGETTATAAEIADRVGMKLRTTERRLAGLVKSGVLSRRRAGSFDATSVWAVNVERLDELSVSAGQPETATLAVSGSQSRKTVTATLAVSETATLAVSPYKEHEELPPTPSAESLATSPAESETIPPNPPQAGGACAKHPNGDGTNCRSCGTTARQVSQRKQAEALARKRDQDAEELRRSRESKPDPMSAKRGRAIAGAARLPLGLRPETVQARAGRQWTLREAQSATESVSTGPTPR